MTAAPGNPEPVRSLALVGLGAIGILYAARIAARDSTALRVIADAERIARYKSDPPTFNGVRLDLNYVPPETPGLPAELVLVAVKSTALQAVLPVIAAVTGPRTQILPLLNGISAQDALAAAFGWPRVLHGFVYCESSMRTGNAVVQKGTARIVFGEAINPVPPAPRVRAVAAGFDRLGIEYHIPPDMRAAQWKKFILNVGINQAQAVLRKPTPNSSGIPNPCASPAPSWTRPPPLAPPSAWPARPKFRNGPKASSAPPRRKTGPPCSRMSKPAAFPKPTSSRAPSAALAANSAFPPRRMSVSCAPSRRHKPEPARFDARNIAG